MAIRPSPSDPEWLPPARLPENAKERAKLVALRKQMGLDTGEAEPLAPPGERIAGCSCPRGGGWRPGARWAQSDIDALPAHQRPPVRELGRRTEAMPVVFQSSPGRGGGPPAKREVEGGLHLASGSPNPLHHASHGPPPRPGEDLPLVTTHRSGQRITLAAVSPEAAALGLAPGMPVTQARVLVPGLETRDADPAADTALLIRLALFAARRWTPTAAVSPPDGLFLDLSGVAHLFGGEAAMCRRILGFCARLGLTARIAVAGTYGAAHALARFAPDPLTLCPTSGEAEAVATLPLAALRLEEAALTAARRLGLESVGDLIAMPRAPLSRRFGKQLLTRLDQALGRAGEAIDPVVPADPPAAALRFAEPIATPEAIADALARLIAALAATLAKGALGLRTLILFCARIDGDEQSIAIGTARATRDAAHLKRLMVPKIEALEPGYGFEAMRLVAPRTEPLAPQPIEGALEGARPAPDLAPLVDTLAGRLGPRRLFRMTALESDVPERSLRRIGPLGQPHGWPERWPRPVRLFPRAEPVENVVALLPDQPPRRFTWRGRAHQVARADGPERIYGEWWRRSGEADAVRDYFQVEDEQGRRFWLYRRGDGVDPRTGDLSWHIQGTFG